ncbi:MAG: S8 family serine peptidase [Thermosynechococcaceae cyanobacterium]
MATVRYGGRAGSPYDLNISDDYLVVRTHNRNPITRNLTTGQVPISPEAYGILQGYEPVLAFEDAGVEVLRAKVSASGRELRDRARTILNAESALEFAGRVLVDSQSNTPVIYTENLFVKFEDDAEEADCLAILNRFGLMVKRSLSYARNAYFVSAPSQTGLRVFDIAEQLLTEESVELCHPELVRESRRRAAFPQQWHLKATTVNSRLINAHANVESAWELSNGTGTTIAIIDDGVDIDHEEFRGKVVAPQDVTRRSGDPRPGNGDNHGTSCAGVACANGSFGASGVAPGARLMPIRLASALGSQAEADAFIWAAQNGADVISCSWGPADGVWYDSSDPQHNQYVPLPDSTRLAMDYAVRQGRNGKGCVILFAAGNGNESVEKDGYASYSNVIAVAACNDSGTRSAYSDMGNAVWCAFPSNNGYPSLTPGIWTTDRTGFLGYNAGDTRQGDSAGNYTNSFGGTSSACPGAAGVAALVIARNPNLRRDEVREILKQCCDRIDPTGGNYDANGHSPLYGYGRLNARRAVELALPTQPNPISIFTARQDVPIRDLETARLTLMVANDQPIAALKVEVEIEHTYIGDLVVTLMPPGITGVAPIVLHQRQGGGTDNLKTVYDAVNTIALANLKGKSPQGTWTLEVSDQARFDTGTIRSFTLSVEH